MEELLLNIQNLVLSVLESGLVIVIAALMAGMIVKRWVPDAALQNKWIPTINLALGAALGIAIPTCFPGVGTVTQGIYGAMCGLSASYLYDKVLSHLFAKTAAESGTEAQTKGE